jgi:hypothetical protein
MSYDKPFAGPVVIDVSQGVANAAVPSPETAGSP